jgi:hypothetical protein
MRGSLNAAALAACVSACSTASGPNMFTALSGGRWSIERDTDRITGRERLSVATISSKTEYSHHGTSVWQRSDSSVRVVPHLVPPAIQRS